METLIDWLLNGLFPAIVGAITALGGTVFYYRQEKDSKEIENESKQADEWRKLYLEAKEDSKEKDVKIEELSKRIDELSAKLIRLEKQFNVFGCYNTNCQQRIHYRPEMGETI